MKPYEKHIPEKIPNKTHIALQWKVKKDTCYSAAYMNINRSALQYPKWQLIGMS